MRAVAHFARAVGAFRALDDVGRLQAVAGDLLDRLVQDLAVVGRIDRERRGAGRDDREHVAFVDQRLRDRLNRSRMRPVLRKSRCRSSTMIRKMRPAVSLRRARRRQDDAFLRRRRRRRREVVHAAAVHQRQRRDVLLDAVFVDLEVVLRQVGDELVLAVARRSRRS